MAKHRMTAAEFAELEPLLSNLNPENIAAARQVLVEGISQATVAKERNQTYQGINKIIRKVVALASDCPAGWKQVVAFYPPEISRQLEEYAEELKTAARNGQRWRSVPGPDLSAPPAKPRSAASAK